MANTARDRQWAPVLHKAMILAAGKGTRLGEFTAQRPKPMLPVGGRPLLEHLLVLLRDQGISDFAINLHYLGTVIRDYFGDGTRWGVHIHYLEEETLLGSAGTLLHLRQYFDQAFLVVSGDLYTDADVRSLFAFHRQRPALLTMALHEAEEPTREGIVATEPRTGRVTRFVEKPPPHGLLSAGKCRHLCDRTGCARRAFRRRSPPRYRQRSHPHLASP